MLHRWKSVRNPLLILIAALLNCAGADGARADDGMPYVAYINADEVFVRSGPGKNFYPTQKLERGARIEVYRHDPGGWFAIRPPEKSFCWISEEFLEPDDSGLARVLGDRVIVRVGSQFSDVRDVIQLRLGLGDEVELIDDEPARSIPNAHGWYKVAPPAGEFRWVHGQFVARDLEETIPGRVATIGQPQFNEEAERVPATVQDSAAAKDDGGDWRARSRRPPQSPADTNVAPNLEDTAAAAPTEEASEAIGASSDDQRERELAAIELELSAMLVADPSVWRFDESLARANALLASGASGLERGRARLLINKIEKFAEIKRRMDSIAVAPTNDRGRARAVDAGTLLGETRDDFDGVGRLARIESPPVGMPGYALTDATGQIRCFVTPAPGVNLRHYLGKEVGISGNIGFMPEHDRQNLTARRIVPLEQPLVR